MTPISEVHVIESDEELNALVQTSLEKAGTTLEELRSQAKIGRFDSEQLRRTWFTVSSLLDE